MKHGLATAVVAMVATATLLASAADRSEIHAARHRGHGARVVRGADAWTIETRETLQSGLLVTFDYDVELRRPSTVWSTAVARRDASAPSRSSTRSPASIRSRASATGGWSGRRQRDQERRGPRLDDDLRAVELEPESPLEANADYYVQRAPARQSARARFALAVPARAARRRLGSRATFTVHPLAAMLETPPARRLAAHARRAAPRGRSTTRACSPRRSPAARACSPACSGCRGRTSEIAPQLLTDVLLYPLLAVDLALLAALGLVLARNLLKLWVEQRQAAPFARFRAKLVAALLAMTIVPAVLVLISGSQIISDSAARWFSEPVDEVLERRADDREPVLPGAAGERDAARAASGASIAAAGRRRRRRGRARPR